MLRAALLLPLVSLMQCGQDETVAAYGAGGQICASTHTQPISTG